jgi:hypothetical protein
MTVSGRGTWAVVADCGRADGGRARDDVIHVPVRRLPMAGMSSRSCLGNEMKMDKISAGTRVKSLTVCGALIALGAAASAFGLPPDGSFKWPTTAVHVEPAWNVKNLGVLGVRAVVLPEEAARIVREKYSSTEHRNLQSAIDNLADPRDAPQHHSSAFEPPSHPGFYVLHAAFGYPQRNGYAAVSFLSRVEYIEDVIVRDNRVNILFRITGSIGGPMYGFKGTGQLINMRESMRYTFDDAGLISKFEPWSAEDLAFYRQLGGAVELPLTASSNNSLPHALTTSMEPLPSSAADYTSTERHNVETLRAVLSDREGLERPTRRYFSPGYKNTDASVYALLDSAYGKADGFKIGSLRDIKRQITDLIAKGDRVWVHYVTEAVQSGPLFGVAATGNTLKWNEDAYVTFDPHGRIVETTRLPVLGEIYLQLGGQFVFPYADQWKCDGCPNNPGIAELVVPSDRH